MQERVRPKMIANFIPIMSRSATVFGSYHGLKIEANTRRAKIYQVAAIFPKRSGAEFIYHIRTRGLKFSLTALAIVGYR